jgi:O-antigen/teichoic acid export membrane protein
MSLTAKTASAVGWTTGAKIAQQALQFGLSIFLMRLLGPETFGLIGMVLVFTGFASIFSEMGFGSALIQRQGLTEAHNSSVFWLTVSSGAAVSAILVIFSPLIARFYDEPLLQPLTACVALTFLLSAPGAVPRSLLRKAMRFDQIAMVQIVSLVLSGAVSVGLALYGAGVWSLVAQSLTVALVGSVLSFWIVDWRPKWIWKRSALRDLAGYGAGLTGFNVINYWARSADNLLIGRFMGADALGLYSRAYSLMLLPLNHIISVLAPAMFPALASIQYDTERVRRAYLRAMRLISFLSFPLMLGLIVVAEPFVLGLLGSQWAGVIPLIQILAVVGMTQSLCNPTGWIYTSQGRTDWMFWWGIGGSSTLVVSIVVGVVLGSVESVAWAYMIGNLIITIPCIAIPGRLIDMRVRDVLRTVTGNLTCAASMALAVWGVHLLLPGHLDSLAELGILVLAGVITYAGLVWLFQLVVIEDLLMVIRQVRPGLYSRLWWLQRPPFITRHAA